MNKSITIKGTGNISVAPDCIEIEATIQTTDKDYGKSISICDEKVSNYYNALINTDIPIEDIKTTLFDVETIYENKYSGNQSKRIFKGYKTTYNLKFRFDFNKEKLLNVLTAIANSNSNAEFSVNFTVKDTSKVKEELLLDATANAKNIAEILAKASNVALGQLTSIDYSWGELNLYSNSFDGCCDDGCDFGAPPTSTSWVSNFNPEDIKIRETVTFVWEIA